MKLKKKKRLRRPRIDINVQQLDEIVDKAAKEPLSGEECDVLKTSIHAMAQQLVSQPRATEKAEELLNGTGGTGEGDAAGEVIADNKAAALENEAKSPRPGHGRNGASDYSRADRIHVGLPGLAAKCACPDCPKGKLYPHKAKTLVRITGMPPIQAKVYELESFRCNLCGEIYSAEAPEGIGEEKYDASVASMVGQLRYGSGMPFNRIEKLQDQMGIPLPAATQFELVDTAAKKMEPVHAELTRLAAQGDVLHDDDTGVRILEHVERPEGQDKDRTGLHTTGVVSRLEEHQIALFISGPQHAGENMRDLLKLRQDGLPEPVVMHDALAANDKVADGIKLLLSNCLTHGRRQFVDVLDSFPEECRHVIEQLGLVYWHDEQVRVQGLDDQARLNFHQEQSGPVMDKLKLWMETQLKEKKTEPNSGLGKAIKYFLKRWDRLTLFLRVPGAPLDNNLVERSLKTAVLHRKNSLFYKTQHGAQVGDLYMSIIHTCRLNGINSFEYMTELQRHAVEVQKNPGAWLPWNYHLQVRPPPD